jgi:hypothetical protein
MTSRDNGRQEELNKRFFDALTALGSTIPFDTTKLVIEMITANEAPIALEILSEVLEERDVSIGDDVALELVDLSQAYFLDPEVETRILNLPRLFDSE